MNSENILEVRGLKTYFHTEEGIVKAVDNLNFDLKKNEVLAIVGESGCGKSMTSLSILNLIEHPGKIEAGSITYMDKDLVKLSNKEMNKIRGKEISMIFQEPMTSLNPVFTIGHQIYESLKYHQHLDKKEGYQKALEMLKMVGIPDSEKVINDYPHQLSGGMRQRAMIAMALACNPKILIADEPTTALDVTIQAQILKLMRSLQEETGTSIIMITHDLGVVAHIASRVMVMYAGQTVEIADVKELFKDYMHPYTEGLLKSVPSLIDDKEELFNIKGSVPSAKDYPKGCRFAPRCEKACAKCFEQMPELIEVKKNHFVRCLKCKEKVNE